MTINCSNTDIHYYYLFRYYSEYCRYSGILERIPVYSEIYGIIGNIGYFPVYSQNNGNKHYQQVIVHKNAILSY